MINLEKQTDRIFDEIDKSQKVTKEQVRGILAAISETYRLLDLDQLLNAKMSGTREKIIGIINTLAERHKDINFVAFVAERIIRIGILERNRPECSTLSDIDPESKRLGLLGEPEQSQKRMTTIILRNKTREEIARNEGPRERFIGNEFELLKFLFINLCKQKKWETWIKNFLKYRLFELKAFQALSTDEEKEKLLEKYCLSKDQNPHKTLRNEYMAITAEAWDELRDKFIEIMLEQLREFITRSDLE